MRKNTIPYILSFFVSLIIFSACKKDNVLSRDKMVEVLRDIQLAEAISSTRYDDFRLKEQKEALINGVLEKHNITRAQLDSSLVWYSDNVDIYNRVNDSVVATLRREQDLLTKRMPRSLRPRKTVNFSILPAFFYLNEANPLLTFTIDSFQIKKYPDLKIDLSTLWVQEDTDADLSVTFTYRDTLINEVIKLDRDTLYTIIKPEVSDTLKMVSGYIQLNTEGVSHQNILLYDIAVRDSIKAELPDIPELSELPAESGDSIPN